VWPFSREAREERRQQRRKELAVAHQRRKAHEVLLLKAASIAEATLICHEDTWHFIVSQCSTGQRLTHFHFTSPSGDEISKGEAGKVKVPLSGRTLAAVLDQMVHDSQLTVTPTVEQAVAKTVRDSIIRALESEDDLPAIIIDSHPRSEVDDEEPQE